MNITSGTRLQAEQGGETRAFVVDIREQQHHVYDYSLFNLFMRLESVICYSLTFRFRSTATDNHCQTRKRLLQLLDDLLGGGFAVF